MTHLGRLTATLLLFLSACADPSDAPPMDAPPSDASPAGAAPLPPGTWIGGLTPMNHPDMVTPITYDVAYDADALVLTLGGPGAAVMPAHDVALDGDTLRFAFDEPADGVRLTCALGRQPEGSFEGRCADADGKWARFTMTPPAG